MRVLNTTRVKVLVDNGERAGTLMARTRGLIGRRGLSPGEGLLICPCQGIHTFFMRFPIDVLYLDRHNSVVRAVSAVPPNRLGPVALRSASVLELPSGTIETTGTREGDTLSISDA